MYTIYIRTQHYFGTSGLAFQSKSRIKPEKADDYFVFRDDKPFSISHNLKYCSSSILVLSSCEIIIA